ncbi:MAG: glycosyltransferase family 9 protein [Candidatus Omnitrophica bacterium]|nr:glycosyltransferase family 9 protein [Candidatus Omnitrophota bacterium]
MNKKNKTTINQQQTEQQSNIMQPLQFDFLRQANFKKFQKTKLFKKLQDNVRTIAIYKGGGGLGDLVVAASFFKTFKQAFPQAKIKYMGVIYPRFQKIFDSIDSIDGYIHYERPDKGKRMKQYWQFRKTQAQGIDLLIDTQRRFETSFWLRMLGTKYMLSASPLLSNWNMPWLNYKKMHILEQLFTLPARLGLDMPENFVADLNIDQQFIANANKMLEGKKGKIVALMPSCGMEFKNWMPEYFAKIGDLFANNGYTIIILGSPKELELFKSIAKLMKHQPIIPAEIDLDFAKELMNDAAILKQCSVAVGNDSGGMHLASCLGVLSATIFGPTTPRKFAPIGPRNIVFYKPMACSPCRFKCNQSIFKQCLNSITPQEVYAACMKNMER